MMKLLTTILLFTLMGCIADEMAHSGTSGAVYKAQQVHCLRDFLIGEDAGGVWSIVSLPIGSTLVVGDLAGDNPCIDFDDYGCGNYSLQYKVTTACCADSVTLNLVNTLDVTITGTCN